MRPGPPGCLPHRPVASGGKTGARRAMPSEDRALAARLARIDTMERTDPDRRHEVRAHEVRVARVSCRLATAAGMGPVQAQEAFRAGRFHDVGKLGIGREILFKEGRLEPHERRRMELHTDLGVGVLTRGGVEAPRYLLDAVLYHHERYDGRGYHGLRGEAIPLIARVVSIADVHDALRADRSYKRGMSEGEALELMIRPDKGFGGAAFDPVLLRVFVAMRLEEAPELFGAAQARALAGFAASDPMDDVQPGTPVTLGRSGHRILWHVEPDGTRRQAALIRPDGTGRARPGFEAHLPSWASPERPVTSAREPEAAAPGMRH